MKIKSALIIFSFFICAAVLPVDWFYAQITYAQEATEDVVYFIDGSIVRGTIAQISREKIRIKQADGTIIERPVMFLYRFSSKRHFTEIYDRAVESGDRNFWNRSRGR